MSAMRLASTSLNEATEQQHTMPSRERRVHRRHDLEQQGVAAHGELGLQAREERREERVGTQRLGRLLVVVGRMHALMQRLLFGLERLDFAGSLGAGTGRHAPDGVGTGTPGP